MADIVYNIFKSNVMDQIDMDSATLKVMLVGTGYTENPDHENVDDGGADDPIDEEIVATNYTGGHGGAGRRTLGSKTFTANDTDDRGEFDAADPTTWSSLGNGTNDTVNGAVLHVEGSVNDTDATLIAFFDLSNFTTNGADFDLQWASAGILHLTSLMGGLQLLGRFREDLWSAISERMTYRQVQAARKIGLRPKIIRRANPAIVRNAIREAA